MVGALHLESRATYHLVTPQNDESSGSTFQDADPSTIETLDGAVLLPLQKVRLCRPRSI